jgi:hypothetical protein
MRSTTSAVACAVLGTLGLLALPASGARADNVSTLSITGFSKMLVDSVHSQLFFSQGSGGADSILVTDFSGNTITTIPEPDAVAGITLSPDSSTLYAALPAGDEVDAISTSTLTQVAGAPYPLGGSNAPFSIAVQNGKLWISYDTGTVGQSSIGEIDPSAQTPTFTPQAAPGLWQTAPLLSSDPSDKGFLVAVEPGMTPTSATSYDTTTAIPVNVRTQTTTLGGTGSSACDNAIDAAVAPAGAAFITGCGASAGDLQFSTSDLSQPPSEYATNAHANAAAISATTGAVAAGTTAASGSDIFVYAANGTTPLNDFSTGATLADRGLGLSADGSELFAVTNSSGTFSLHAFQLPTITRTTLTLTGAATAVAGRTLNLSGSLTLGNAAQPPVSATVIVTRTAPDSTQTQLPGAPVQPDGTFKLTDIPVAPGAYSYTARYLGDSATAASASTALAVTVTRNTSTLTLSAPKTAVDGKALKLTGSLTLGNGPLPLSTTVTITRTAPDKKQTQLTGVPVASNGSFTATDTPTEVGHYTYVASYNGDISIAPATSPTLTVAAALNTATLKLSGPPVVTFGASVVVTGKLTLGVGSPAPGTVVTVVRTVAGSTATKTFPPVKLNSGGGFTLTDHAPAKGRYTYTATYAGNPTTATAKAALRVTVARTTPTLQLITSSPNYVFGTRITVTAALGATFADRTVSIYATPAGQSTMLLKTGKVDADGELSVSYMLSRSTVFSVVFAGDVHNAPVTVTRGVGAFVKIVMTNSGYFETTTIRGIKFRVYHHTGHLNTAITVTPNKQTQCVDLEVQQWDSQRGWFANTTIGCYTLSSTSQINTFVTLLGAGGAEYRMRADYVRSTTDTTNINTDGAWFYFEVVK